MPILYFTFSPEIDPIAPRFKILEARAQFFTREQRALLEPLAHKANKNIERFGDWLTEQGMDVEAKGVFARAQELIPENFGEWAVIAIFYLHLAGDQEKKYWLHLVRRRSEGGWMDTIHLRPREFAEPLRACEELFTKINQWLERPEEYPEHIIPIDKGVASYMADMRENLGLNVKN